MKMSEQLRFLCLSAVIEKTSLSKTTIYSISDFPKPIKIRGSAASIEGGSRWVESEVNAWMASRLHQRDAQRDPAKVEAAPRPLGFPYLRRKQDPAKARRREGNRKIAS
jgi:predicted DNA-binding transcriptional regulator AlpA